MNFWRHLRNTLRSERGSWVITAVVLTTASVGMSVASAVAAGKNAKKQSQQVADQAKADSLQKSRATLRLAATQRASFLQGGISLTGDDDTPNSVTDETFRFGEEDIKQLGKNAVANISNVVSQARTQQLQALSQATMTAAGGLSKLNLGTPAPVSDGSDMLSSGAKAGMSGGF